MAIPRADGTIPARVKTLEDWARRVKLLPSVTQSAAAPTEVAKFSVFYDQSAGNAPSYFDGTSWVPVRDETIAVAQTTADTAQADATQAAADAVLAQAAADAAQAAADLAAAQAAALQAELDTLNDVTLPALQTELDGILPITETDIADDAITTPKIAANAVTAAEIAANTITANEMAADSITANEIAAGAIDGQTITGAWIRTASSSARIALNDPAYPGQVALYTGAPAEIEPALIRPVVSGTTSYLTLKGPKTTSPDAAGRLDLTAEGDGTSGAAIDADVVHLFGTDTTIDGFSSLKLGDGTDYVTITGQAVTDADLSDASNVFPASLASLTGSQTLTNKNLTSGTNTFPTSLATLTGTQTLTNKDLSSGTNTLPTSVATLTGTQALTNKDLTASTNTFPGQMLTQVLTAAMTGAAVAATTTEADIVGATVTFTTTKANARYAASASFYYSANTGGSGIATGKLSIDGTNQAAQANFTGVTTLERANVAQSWTGTLAATGSHTFKLRQILSGTGDFRVNPTHTALTVQIFE